MGYHRCSNSMNVSALRSSMESLYNLGLDLRGISANIKTQANSEINPYIYGQRFLIRVPRLFSGERTVFSTNDVGKTGYPCAKE